MANVKGDSVRPSTSPPVRSNGVVWTVAVANSPALTVQSWTVALGESGGAGEQSATPIAQQLSSTTSFHVVPADCSGRRWLHQSIIIFACAASCCFTLVHHPEKSDEQGDPRPGRFAFKWVVGQWWSRARQR